MVMVGGLVFIVGLVMVGYVGMGVELKYLFVVSFMVVLGGLFMVKIILLEISKFNEELKEIDVEDIGYVNVFDVVVSGVVLGMIFVLNVGVMFFVFIVFIVMFNGFIGWFVVLFGYENVIFEGILGYVF